MFDLGATVDEIFIIMKQFSVRALCLDSPTLRYRQTGLNIFTLSPFFFSPIPAQFLTQFLAKCWHCKFRVPTQTRGPTCGSRFNTREEAHPFHAVHVMFAKDR